MSKQSSAIARLFGGNHPVRDARPGEAMMVNTTDEDWKKGKKSDPRNCAIAIAWKRTMALTEVEDLGLAILKEIAYVPMPSKASPTGIMVLRYMVTGPQKEWDKGARVFGGVVFLRPPSETQTLEATRQYNKRYRRGGVENGPVVRKPGKPRGPNAAGTIIKVRGGLYHHHHVVIKKRRAA
jgi:hypothetical protein